MKKIIGIVPKGIPYETENDRLRLYELGDSYAKRIKEVGGIAICLAPVDGRISPEQLALCDGFLAQGGNRMWPYHFQIIHHAVTTGKKYLGICLGMQLIHRYFAMKQMVGNQKTEDAAIEQIIDLFFNQGIGEDLLHRVEGHRTVDSVLDAHKAKHPVSVVPETVLHHLLGKEEIAGASFHNWCVKDPVDTLTVNAWAADGTIEGIENGSNILGVQFHPEVDDSLPEIFRFLTEE